MTVSHSSPPSTLPARRHIPALDAIRALSVISVVGYHLHVPGFGGGFFGVGVFFTLSGYLITSNVISEVAQTRRLRIRSFWTSRFRRLIPALIVMVVAVLVATAVAQPAQLGDRSVQGLVGVTYVSNWFVIVTGKSYFDHFSGAGPFDHLWSLAIEEQFYVVFPLLVAGSLQLGKTWQRGRRILVGIVCLLTLASFWALFATAQVAIDNTRAYEGTDTRAGAILVGALLALRMQGSTTARWGRLGSTMLDLVGVIALIGLVLLVLNSNDYSMKIYQWQLLAVALGTALVLLAVVRAPSELARLLSPAPLRWLGERSYGLYLWHVPVATFANPARFSAPWLQWVFVAAVTVLIAAWSHHFVEQPIRRLGFVRALSGRSTTGTRSSKVGWDSRPLGTFSVWCSVVAFGAALLVAATVEPVSASRAELGAADLVESSELSQQEPVPVNPPSSLAPAPTTLLPTGPTTPAPPSASATGCLRVAHIGDSTSIGLMSPAFLPDPQLRIDARYRAVGASVVATDISGGRSIVERLKRQPNAEEAAKSLRIGQPTCWVFALGINEAANVAVGSRIGATERIRRMMAQANGDPVLWPTVRTQTSRTAYANKNMLGFNKALLDACATYPNLVVYDWAADVSPRWYQPDGIHYTSPGNERRAALFADALRRAFPSNAMSNGTLATGWSRPTSCTVRAESQTVLTPTTLPPPTSMPAALSPSSVPVTVVPGLPTSQGGTPGPGLPTEVTSLPTTVQPAGTTQPSLQANPATIPVGG